MVLPQYELMPKLEFVSYYYQLVLVRYTCIARMRFWWFVHYASTCGAFWILTCGKIWWNVRLGSLINLGECLVQATLRPHMTYTQKMWKDSLRLANLWLSF